MEGESEGRKVKGGGMKERRLRREKGATKQQQAKRETRSEIRREHARLRDKVWYSIV
jgi:hypothetical protein